MYLCKKKNRIIFFNNNNNTTIGTLIKINKTAHLQQQASTTKFRDKQKRAAIKNTKFN